MESRAARVGQGEERTLPPLPGESGRDPYDVGAGSKYRSYSGIPLVRPPLQRRIPSPPRLRSRSYGHYGYDVDKSYPGDLRQFPGRGYGPPRPPPYFDHPRAPYGRGGSFGPNHEIEVVERISRGPSGYEKETIASEVKAGQTTFPMPLIERSAVIELGYPYSVDREVRLLKNSYLSLFLSSNEITNKISRTEKSLLCAPSTRARSSSFLCLAELREIKAEDLA